MKNISTEQIIYMHEQLIKITGGRSGIRDDTLLVSAINAPYASFAGNELFPTIEEKAARLGFGITKNHPFMDGNKRTGAHLMLVFLKINNIKLYYRQEELVEIILKTASSVLSYDKLLEFIKEKEKEK